MIQFFKHNRPIYYVITLIILTVPISLHGAQIPKRISQELNHLIGAKDALVIGDINGAIIYHKQKNLKLVPASTLKLLTALFARHTLGAVSRFVTEVWQDQQGNLKIKGYGDPFLVSEIVATMALQLAANLPKTDRTFEKLILDESYFAAPLIIPGVSNSAQPYDAPNGALSVNFNTVDFKTVGGKIKSAEKQTPLLKEALNRIKKSNLEKGRLPLSRENGESLRYTGALFRYFFNKKGIKIRRGIAFGTVDTLNDRLILKFNSPKTLDDLIQKLLAFSNNFLANQLLVAAGAKINGPPGTLSSGVQALKEYGAKHLNLSDLQVTEGSGISRRNQMTAGELYQIVMAFKPFQHLMRKEGKDIYKTGSLKGVRTRAGFIQNKMGRLNPYALMINTPGKSTHKIMGIIKSIHE